MKLTKNLVTIPGSLWTRYLICKAVLTTHSVVHSFIVYCTFYSLLFPLGHFEYPSNETFQKMFIRDQRIFYFFLITLQSCHQCKISENFTKILNKFVHHGLAGENFMILRIHEFHENKLREKHKRSVVNSLWKATVLQVIQTMGKKTSLNQS